MKKLGMFMVATPLAFILVACGASNDHVASSEPNNMANAPDTSEGPSESIPPQNESQALTNDEGLDDSSPSTELKTSEEPISEMTSEELDAVLLEQPMYVESTDYVVQDEQLKSLYPDMLQAVIKNNSGTDIKNVIVAFAAWDENGFPVKIEGNHDLGRSSYIKFCNYLDVNMVDGATYGQDSGMALARDTNNIATFKAIIVSYDDFDGNTWENPYYNTWEEKYEDKKLS